MRFRPAQPSDCALLRLLPALVITFAVCAQVHAQVGESVLNVDDGVKAQSVARLSRGQWVAAPSCRASQSRGEAASSGRLTATGGLQVALARSLAPGSPEWMRLAPTIIALFDRREREQRVAAEQTSDAPRAIDWIYTAETGGLRLHYFEASRRVASASADVDHDTDPPGTLRIAVAGFLRDGREGITALGTKSELRWEQDGLPAGPNLPDLTPLGVVPHGDQSVWVMKRQSGDSVWFSLYEVGGKGTRTLVTMRSAC